MLGNVRMKESKGREEEIMETKAIKEIKEIREEWGVTIAKNSVTSLEIVRMVSNKEELSVMVVVDKDTLPEIVLNKIDLIKSKIIPNL